MGQRQTEKESRPKGFKNLPKLREVFCRISYMCEYRCFKEQTLLAAKSSGNLGTETL
jgi:hypothetical protein